MVSSHTFTHVFLCVRNKSTHFIIKMCIAQNGHDIRAYGCVPYLCNCCVCRTDGRTSYALNSLIRFRSSDRISAFPTKYYIFLNHFSNWNQKSISTEFFTNKSHQKKKKKRLSICVAITKFHIQNTTKIIFTSYAFDCKSHITHHQSHLLTNKIAAFSTQKRILCLYLVPQNTRQKILPAQHIHHTYMHRLNELSKYRFSF